MLSGKRLRKIDYGETQIILERGKHTMLASVVYGEANRDLRSRMSRALTKIEDEFSSKLKSWDGDVDSLSKTVNHLQPIMDISKPVTKDMIDEPGVCTNKSILRSNFGVKILTLRSPPKNAETSFGVPTVALSPIL